VPGHPVIRSVNHVTSAVMATVTSTYLVDDLDGSDDDVSTVRFHLDKRDYEIDLGAANEEQLREKLAKFLDAATPVGPRRARTTAAHKTVKAIPASRDQTQPIREWARGAGYVVSERGRIPKNVQEAFNQAH
jgi:Lsr2